jgi:hypoxanthine phosphoribosyltransferase
MGSLNRGSQQQHSTQSTFAGRRRAVNELSRTLHLIGLRRAANLVYIQRVKTMARPKNLPAEVESILLTREAIARRVAELGEAISRDYTGADLVLIGVLRGAIVFLADLIRAIGIPHRYDLIGASSYGESASSSGRVTITEPVRGSLEGCDVLIVEDILDTGLTTSVIMKEIESLAPRSVDLCVLLSKQRERRVPIEPRYVGFEIPDEFVVGYGLDYAERFRHLDCIGILSPNVYQDA